MNVSKAQPGGQHSTFLRTRTSLLSSTGEAALSGNSSRSSASPRAEHRGGMGSRERGLHCLPGAAGRSPLNWGQECSQLQTHPPPPMGQEPSWGGAAGGPGGRGGHAPSCPHTGKLSQSWRFSCRQPSSSRGPPAQGARGGWTADVAAHLPTAPRAPKPFCAGITGTSHLTKWGN